MPIVTRSAPDRGRIDWRSVRDTIDLAAVVARYLGPAPKRSGRRLLWHCPFHDDRNPSFVVDPDKRRWDCWPCGIGGWAAGFVMKMDGVSYPEALAILTGDRPAPRKGSAPRPAPHRADPPAAPRPATRPEAPASRGMDPETAKTLVDEAAVRLWTPEGSAALAYLTARGLAPETIRAARLGWAPRIVAHNAQGHPYTARGIVIPWFASGRLTMVKIRPDRQGRPKYLNAFQAGYELYPSPEVIRPGRPLVIVEGEFDALLLGQALGDRASVVTFGSASVGMDAPTPNRLITAPAWFIAHDADPAGDKAAAAWAKYPRSRRIRPPDPFKDWTDAARGGVDLAGWWSGILNPPLFTGEDLESWRWGPALEEQPEAPPEG